MMDPGVLQKVALLRGLPPDQIENVLPLLHERSFSANTNVIAAEEPGEGVYAILSGTVKVYVNDADGSEIIIAILGPGEVVGEMSLADSPGRSANVLPRFAKQTAPKGATNYAIDFERRGPEPPAALRHLEGCPWAQSTESPIMGWLSTSAHST